MIKLFLLSIAIAIVSFALMPLSARADPDLDKPAPSFIVKQLDGKIFKLADEKGKVVIVNFWATWCPPCRDEMPLLNTMYKRYQAQGLDLIGISVDRDSHRRQVELIMRDFAYPAAMQNDARDDDFGWMSSVPDTYIFDRQGILRVKYEGDQLPLDEKKLAAILEPLLQTK